MGSEIVVYRRFEEIRRLTSEGTEYWSARELMPLLGYDSWDNFSNAIHRARQSCESVGAEVSTHFHDAIKVEKKSNGVEYEMKDVALSRYAGYLVAMNGDPRKKVIADAQAYFAIKTREKEIEDQASNTGRRLELRERVRTGNKALSKAAIDAGVPARNMGIFHDKGYRGMYGHGLKNIKRIKGLDDGADLLDHAGRAELAANEFRITQTEQKLIRDNVEGESAANEVHYEVGVRVRTTIRTLGGTMPEDMKPEQSLKQIRDEKRKQIKEAEKLQESDPDD